MKDPLKYLLENPPERKTEWFYELLGITVFAVVLIMALILL